eukprot:2142301-Amphidinium_carterae.1
MNSSAIGLQGSIPDKVHEERGSSWSSCRGPLERRYQVLCIQHLLQRGPLGPSVSSSLTVMTGSASEGNQQLSTLAHKHPTANSFLTFRTHSLRNAFLTFILQRKANILHKYVERYKVTFMANIIVSTDYEIAQDS